MKIDADVMLKRTISGSSFDMMNNDRITVHTSTGTDHPIQFGGRTRMRSIDSFDPNWKGGSQCSLTVDTLLSVMLRVENANCKLNVDDSFKGNLDNKTTQQASLLWFNAVNCE
jgi:hypothetical protein